MFDLFLLQQVVQLRVDVAELSAIVLKLAEAIDAEKLGRTPHGENSPQFFSIDPNWPQDGTKWASTGTRLEDPHASGE